MNYQPVLSYDYSVISFIGFQCQLFLGLDFLFLQLAYLPCKHSFRGCSGVDTVCLQDTKRCWVDIILLQKQCQTIKSKFKVAYQHWQAVLDAGAEFFVPCFDHTMLCEGHHVMWRTRQTFDSFRTLLILYCDDKTSLLPFY